MTARLGAPRAFARAPTRGAAPSMNQHVHCCAHGGAVPPYLSKPLVRERAVAGRTPPPGWPSIAVLSEPKHAGSLRPAPSTGSERGRLASFTCGTLRDSVRNVTVVARASPDRQGLGSPGNTEGKAMARMPYLRKSPRLPETPCTAGCMLHALMDGRALTPPSRPRRRHHAAGAPTRAAVRGGAARGREAGRYR